VDGIGTSRPLDRDDLLLAEVAGSPVEHTVVAESHPPLQAAVGTEGGGRNRDTLVECEIGGGDVEACLTVFADSLHHAILASMAKDDRDITGKVLLEHMQAMQRVLKEELESVRDELAVLRTSLTGEMREVKDVLRMLEARLTIQIDAIDKRLDAVEIESLPRRVAALEAKVR